MNRATPHIRSASDVRKLGTILFVGAHPDDETFCSGGLLAIAARNGQRVICVTATHGEQGVQDETRWPQKALAQIREKELAAAMIELGVTEHHWLPYKDGACDQVGEDDAAHHLGAIIERAHVDSIITFGPDGLTGHADHRTMSRWVDGAVHQSSVKPQIYHIVQPRETYEAALADADKTMNIFFNIETPPLVDEKECAVYVRLDSDSAVRKFLALKVMPSQTEKLLQVIPPEKFGAAFGIEALVSATDART